MFYKLGVPQLQVNTSELFSLTGVVPELFSLVFGVLLNPYIFAGILLYAVGFVFLLISYRGGEASVLYPIFASSYVWVVLLSNYWFNEVINAWKITGVLVIVLGITVLVSGGWDGAIAMEDPV